MNRHETRKEEKMKRRIERKIENKNERKKERKKKERKRKIHVFEIEKDYIVFLRHFLKPKKFVKKLFHFFVVEES